MTFILPLPVNESGAILIPSSLVTTVPTVPSRHFKLSPTNIDYPFEIKSCITPEIVNRTRYSKRMRKHFPEHPHLYHMFEISTGNQSREQRIKTKYGEAIIRGDGVDALDNPHWAEIVSTIKNYTPVPSFSFGYSSDAFNLRGVKSVRRALASLAIDIIKHTTGISNFNQEKLRRRYSKLVRNESDAIDDITLSISKLKAILPPLVICRNQRLSHPVIECLESCRRMLRRLEIDNPFIPDADSDDMTRYEIDDIMRRRYGRSLEDIEDGKAPGVRDEFTKPKTPPKTVLELAKLERAKWRETWAERAMKEREECRDCWVIKRGRIQSRRGVWIRTQERLSTLNPAAFKPISPPIATKITRKGGKRP